MENEGKLFDLYNQIFYLNDASRKVLIDTGVILSPEGNPEFRELFDIKLRPHQKISHAELRSFRNKRADYVKNQRFLLDYIKQTDYIVIPEVISELETRLNDCRVSMDFLNSNDERFKNEIKQNYTPKNKIDYLHVWRSMHNIVRHKLEEYTQNLNEFIDHTHENPRHICSPNGIEFKEGRFYRYLFNIFNSYYKNPKKNDFFTDPKILAMGFYLCAAKNLSHIRILTNDTDLRNMAFDSFHKIYLNSLKYPNGFKFDNKNLKLYQIIKMNESESYMIKTFSMDFEIKKIKERLLNPSPILQQDGQNQINNSGIEQIAGQNNIGLPGAQSV